MQDTKQDQGRTTPSLAMMSAGPLSKHLAALAAAGIKRRPLAPGESYAKGLPEAEWPKVPGGEAA